MATASFSNILTNKRVGLRTLEAAHKGLLQIIDQELAFVYDTDREAFISTSKPDKWKPKPVPEFDEKRLSPKEGVTFRPEGRLSIQEKVAFMQTAQSEVIEFGVRLRTYSDYFTSRKESEFNWPVRELLKKKVDFKLYLVEPDSHYTRLYFDDRGQVQPREAHSPEVIKNVLGNLRELCASLKAEGYPGQFDVFTYKHIPYNHFLIVDGVKPYGKMIVSHYLYGIRRANCPVLIIHKQYSYDLFRRYWDSFKMLTRGAKKVDFGTSQ
jgi:hypothetical protein